MIIFFLLLFIIFFFFLPLEDVLMEWSGRLLSTPNPHFNQDVRTQTRPVRRSFTRTGSPPAGRRDNDISTSRLAWMINRFRLSLSLSSCSYTRSFKRHPRALLFPLIPPWPDSPSSDGTVSGAARKADAGHAAFPALCVCQTSAFALNCMFMSTTEM